MKRLLLALAIAMPAHATSVPSLGITNPVAPMIEPAPPAPLPSFQIQVLRPYTAPVWNEVRGWATVRYAITLDGLLLASNPISLQTQVIDCQTGEPQQEARYRTTNIRFIRGAFQFKWRALPGYCYRLSLIASGQSTQILYRVR